jgi:hypothetical protein
MPAEARPATIEGAQKFAAFWVSQLNLAFKTPNPAPIAELSTVDCVACQGFVSDADDLRRKGEHAEGDLWAVNDAYLEDFDNVASAVVVVTIKQNPVNRVDNNGAVILRYKPRVEDVALTLQHAGSAWVVTKLQVVK